MKSNLLFEFSLIILLIENSLSYYSDCDRAYQEKNSSALFLALRNITSAGKVGSYSGLWNIYLTAYAKSDGYIKDYYSSYSKFTSENQDNGSGGTIEGDKYNREHSIPKSWWGGTTAAGTQGADPFIVIPTDKFINNKRNNCPFGIVSKVDFSSFEDYSKMGKSEESYGYSGTVFEPNDEVKGDLARIVFYSIIKYNSSFQWNLNGGSVYYTGNESQNYGLTDYAIKLFTEWNELDPPDEWEISLNKALYEIQGNTNPFIDHPEYVNILWGNVPGATYYTGIKIEMISMLNNYISLSIGDNNETIS